MRKILLLLTTFGLLTTVYANPHYEKRMTKLSKMTIKEYKKCKKDKACIETAYNKFAEERLFWVKKALKMNPRKAQKVVKQLLKKEVQCFSRGNWKKCNKKFTPEIDAALIAEAK